MTSRLRKIKFNTPKIGTLVLHWFQGFYQDGSDKLKIHVNGLCLDLGIVGGKEKKKEEIEKLMLE